MANYDIMIKSYEDLLANKPESCNVEAINLSINAMKIDTEQIDAVMETLRWLLDTYDVKKVL